MGFTCGIVGLPNVGKSTLFNALTAAGAEASNYPFCTIDPNIGVVSVPDRRLEALAVILNVPRIVPTTIEFVDIAGLVRGASHGEGLGNQFLSHVREVDAIAHVVRCFDDPNVVHVDGFIDPKRDIEVVEAELILKDLETVERRLSEAEKRAKSGDRKTRAEAGFLAQVREHLGSGRFARFLAVQSEEESTWLREMHLLTGKPLMYVCNIPEQDLTAEPETVRTVRAIAAREGAEVVCVSAEVEAEIAELPPDERPSYLTGVGLAESGLARVIRSGYTLLRLVTFFTANAKELRAWTVRRGTPAPEAAGVIHSDFARGFIRAEVIKVEDLVRLGSEHAVKDHGLLHVEGHDYIVEDGDLMLFRFNV
jgi:ribosome-binding ATPase